MKKLLQTLLAVSAFSLANVFAGTLELADGTLLEVDFVGSSNGIDARHARAAVLLARSNWRSNSPIS